MNYIQFCKSVGETLVYSVQMKNTVNCCSHGNVLMCSTRCSISRRNRVLRGGLQKRGESFEYYRALGGGSDQFYFKCLLSEINYTEERSFLSQLTHGILNKEMSHLKEDDSLQCNDSVKIETKEYIKNYKKKFGAEYKRS